MRLTADEARRLAQAAGELNQAQIYGSKQDPKFEVQIVDLDLSTAGTRNIEFPFRSVFVRTASDTVTEVNLQLGTDATFQGSLQLTKNDSFVLPYSVARGVLSWSAQSGKTMRLVFFVSGEFRSGSQISQTGGGVAIVDGSSYAESYPTLSAATTTSILSSDTNRKLAVIRNYSGASIFVGGSAITGSGATIGEEIQAGGTYYWRNTAALYAYSVGAVAAGGIYMRTES